MRKYLLPLAAGAIVTAAASANAAQTSANFQARITIQTACVVSASNLDFGNVGVINGGETATANVDVNCSNGTPYTMSFDSLASVTSFNSTMVNGAEDVDYSAALSASGGTGTGSVQTYTIDGLLPAQSTPTPGIYTDNQTVYVNY
jgi:spore coat protein U-like protein